MAGKGSGHKNVWKSMEVAWEPMVVTSKKPQLDGSSGPRLTTLQIERSKQFCYSNHQDCFPTGIPAPSQSFSRALQQELHDHWQLSLLRSRCG